MTNGRKVVHFCAIAAALLSHSRLEGDGQRLDKDRHNKRNGQRQDWLHLRCSRLKEPPCQLHLHWPFCCRARRSTGSAVKSQFQIRALESVFWCHLSREGQRIPNSFQYKRILLWTCRPTVPVGRLPKHCRVSKSLTADGGMLCVLLWPEEHH